MKKIGWMAGLLALGLLVGAAIGQSTTVSTTGVVDSDGFAWSGGTYTITFVPNSSYPNLGSYNWSGGNLQSNALFVGTLNSSGAFSVSIPTSTAITPSGSQWKYTVCPNATSGCFNVNAPATGTTQNITSILNAVAQGPRFPSNPTAFGYGTIEVTPNPLPGAFFYNTTTNSCNQYSTTGWISCGASGGGGTTANPIAFNNSGAGAASPVSFNGSTGQTISYNTLGAAPATGSTAYLQTAPASPQAIPNGDTATTQAAGDTSTAVATDQFVQNTVLSGQFILTSVPSALNQTVSQFSGSYYGLVAYQPATSSVNRNSPYNCIEANYWSGSASSQDPWCWLNVVGTGTNPTSTLTFQHGVSSFAGGNNPGTSGALTIDLAGHTLSTPQHNKEILGSGTQIENASYALTNPCLEDGTNCPSTPGTSFTDGNFQPDPDNPIAGSGTTGFQEVESNGTCANLFAQPPGTVSYITATDIKCKVWSAPTYPASLQGQTYGAISVVNTGSLYYMLAVYNGGGGGLGHPANVYLLSSTTLNGTWTLLNSGNPVFSGSSTTTATNYSIFNVAFTIIGSTWHFIWEGGTQSADDAYFGYSWSTTCPSSCNFNTNANTSTSTGFFPGHFSPHLILVPDNNDLVMVSTQQINKAGFTGDAEVAYTIPASTSPSNIAVMANWTLDPNFLMWNENIQTPIADFKAAWSPTPGLKAFEAFATYDYNNGPTSQAYSQLTLDQWDNAIKGGPSTSSYPRFANFLNQTGTGSIVAQNSPTLQSPLSTNPTNNGVTEYGTAYTMNWKASPTMVLGSDNRVHSGWSGNPMNDYWFRTPLSQGSATIPSVVPRQQVVTSASGQYLSQTVADDVVDLFHGCYFIASGNQTANFMSYCGPSGYLPGLWTNSPITAASYTQTGLPAGCAQLPCIVGSYSATGLTASSLNAVYTPATNGHYRVCVNISDQTASSTSYTLIAEYARTTLYSTSASSAAFGGTLDLVNGNNHESSDYGYNCAVISAKANTSISLGAYNTGGTNTGGVYAYSSYVEYLGP